ncbi:MAG: HAD-IIIC family phosphatase [Alphaproteobacteria bacterium]|nr:HAD-IIIC family phosphatase [Alphaproteobacteria bacterium]
MSETPSSSKVIGIAGTFTVDPLALHLKKELGKNDPSFAVAPYNQITQLSFNPEQILDAPTDLLIVLWRLEDIGFEELDSFIDTIKRLRENYKGTLIVSTPPYPSTSEFDVHDLSQAASGQIAYAQALIRFTEEVKKINSVNLLNLAGLIENFGSANAHDIRKWYLYKQPYSEKFWKVIAEQMARLISAQTIPAKKCIVLDADNTLWGGIIGEDGVGGIELGQDFPGSAFYDFQKHLLHLRAQGIFLALASKNNPEDVQEVFDTHDTMVLKRGSISAWQVHWNSKVDSLKTIAAELNIGLDALVFVDDNPKEIAEVTERLPEVTCLMVPEEIAELPDLLRNTGLFDIPNMTEEDKKRADMMLAETKRKSEGQTMSEEDFIKSLELKIEVFEAQEQHLGRITQLINKTNQFNVTTIRRNADEVKALHENSDIVLLGMNISDRFGEYGLVGVVILEKADEKIWNIDSLMMSCRVLGRGAETSMLFMTGQVAAAKGAQTLCGTYIPTPKNKLVENLYKDHNFKSENDGWEIDIKDLPAPPDYVDVSLTMKEGGD